MVPRDVTARVFKGKVIALTAPDGEGKTEDVRFPTTTARRPNRRDEGDHHSLCAGVTAGCEVSGQSPE